MLRRKVRVKPNHWKGKGRSVAVLLGLLLLTTAARGQVWVWTTETVDRSGEYSSIAADEQGNLHVSYIGEQEKVKYAYRSAGSSRWFTMTLDNTAGWNGVPTKVALDPQGNPHVCYTPGVMKYAFFDSKRWNIQQIAPGFGNVQFTCAVAIASGGTPHLSWYQYATADGSLYLHLKYAVLQDGAWIARTIDFERQTGKWHSLVLDSQGNPHLSYDSFVDGQLKYAYWNGKEWNFRVVESNAPGVASDLRLSRDGKAQISYEDEDSLKYARQQENSWLIETVGRITPGEEYVGQRTHQVLDKHGFPHIAYEDGGAVKHAYWDGTEWHLQVISAPGPDRARFSEIAIDGKSTLYIAYRDAFDGSLKVAVGRLTAPSQTATAQKKEKE